MRTMFSHRDTRCQRLRPFYSRFGRDSKPSRPFLSAVQDSVDFDDVFTHTINRQIGEAGKYQFTSSCFAATPPKTRKLNERAYGFMDGKLKGRTWASGDNFTMADCAAAPFLFYADWVHQIPDAYPEVRAYRTRLLKRPSVARAVDEARPYRPLFPLGAPDRD